MLTSVSLTAQSVTQPVKVVNGPGQPVPTLEAVQVYGSHCSVSFGGSDSGGCAFVPIPFGKELVVQEFDAFGRVETGNRPFEIALGQTITVGNYFPYTFMVNANGFDFLTTHQETRVYVLQGSTPQCFVALPAASQGIYNCNISGFLVDVPLSEQPTKAQDPKPLSQLFPKMPGR